MRSICNKAALVLALICLTPTVFAQRGQAPPPDPAAVQRGIEAYSGNCAACHGTDARGGRGPDLARSLIIIGDSSGRALGTFVRAGTAEMPRINLTDAQFSDIATFVLAEAQTASTRRPADAALVLVGDAKAGEAYFNGEGNCAKCHSVADDLKGIGAKYPPQTLQGRLAFPRGRGGYPGSGQATVDPPLNAAATLSDGRRITGTVSMLSDFLVTIHTADGGRHTVSRTEKANVVVTDPLHAHADRLRVMTDRQMHNLTAYLAGVK